VSDRRFLRARTALLAALNRDLHDSSSPCDALAVRTASPPPPELSRFDFYAGYGYFNPGESAINNTAYLPINPVAVVRATAYFNRYLGVQAEGSFFPNGPNDCVGTTQIGPILRFQSGRLVPFIHVLGGGARSAAPSSSLHPGLVVNRRRRHRLHSPLTPQPFFALRPVQADFEYSHVDYGPVDPAQVTGGIGDIYAYRFSAGSSPLVGTPPTKRASTPPASSSAPAPNQEGSSKIMLPAGASFAPGDTETVDSSGHKRHCQAYSVPR
jgi:hypothetical protein